jgi:hypothetical protein
MTYADSLTRIQEMRRALRDAERAAEAEAKRMQPLTEVDERRLYADRVEFDPGYVAAGRMTPAPSACERPEEFRRRLAAGLQALSPRWSRADVAKMPAEVFEIAASQICADAIVHGKTAGLRPGELRELPSESRAGHRTVEFAGASDAWFGRQFHREPRRAMFKSQEQYNQISRDGQMARLAEIVHTLRPPLQAPRAAF